LTGKPHENVTVGGIWRNVNEPRLTGYRDRIQESLVLGLTVRVIPGGIISADIVQEKHFPAEFRIGAEARVLPQLVLRVGGRAEPVRPSAGMQIDIRRWSFYYAGDLHPDLGASHQAGIGLRFEP
jgi:hypothetical protein